MGGIRGRTPFTNEDVERMRQLQEGYRQLLLGKRCDPHEANQMAYCRAHAEVECDILRAALLKLATHNDPKWDLDYQEIAREALGIKGIYVERVNYARAENERLRAALRDIAKCPDGGCATCNEEAKIALEAK